MNKFSTICDIARDNGKPVRIGVNGGSLNQELVMRKMQENTDRILGLTSDQIINECMVISALESTDLALQCGLREDQIIISCKVSRPLNLHHRVPFFGREETRQPLHLGLTEAGMGTKGARLVLRRRMGILLHEGIGDTIRISLTPRPAGDRREEVYAACELLQALGLRSFLPSVTACPGCGRTTSTTFQQLAESIQGYIREKMPEWKREYEGVESMTLAVMGCIVNGPGESRAANIGISLPGTGETPSCPVYIDGQHFTTAATALTTSSPPRFRRWWTRSHLHEISARQPVAHASDGPERKPSESPRSGDAVANTGPIKDENYTRRSPPRRRVGAPRTERGRNRLFARHLDSILDYSSKLNELDTDAVEPMAQVLPPGAAGDAAAGPQTATPMREDVPEPCEIIGDVLAGAPDPDPPYFCIPR